MTRAAARPVNRARRYASAVNVMSTVWALWSVSGRKWPPTGHRENVLNRPALLRIDQTVVPQTSCFRACLGTLILRNTLLSLLALSCPGNGSFRHRHSSFFPVSGNRQQRQTLIPSALRHRPGHGRADVYVRLVVIDGAVLLQIHGE